MELAFCWQLCRSYSSSLAMNWGTSQLSLQDSQVHHPEPLTSLDSNLGADLINQTCYWYNFSCVVHPSFFSCRQKFFFAKARTFFTGSAKCGSERFFALRQISGRVPANSEPFASAVSWPVFSQVYNNWRKPLAFTKGPKFICNCFVIQKFSWFSCLLLPFRSFRDFSVNFPWINVLVSVFLNLLLFPAISRAFLAWSLILGVFAWLLQDSFCVAMILALSPASNRSGSSFTGVCSIR